jgi:hypothetical protein
MNIFYETNDKSLRYHLQYFTKNRLTYYKGNKNYPLYTQCLIFRNDLVAGYGEVIKHENDEHNQKYAYIKATEKAFQNSKINSKFIRKDLWDLLFQTINFTK